MSPEDISKNFGVSYNLKFENFGKSQLKMVSYKVRIHLCELQGSLDMWMALQCFHKLSMYKCLYYNILLEENFKEQIPKIFSLAKP
jgi:hypothetical protein